MACFRTFHFLSSHRDERWVCGPFILIAASRRDIKNGLRQNLSFPFTLLAPIGVVSTSNGGTRVLQVKTNAVNKIANRFFCGLFLFPCKTLHFFKAKSRNSCKNRGGCSPEANSQPTWNPVSPIFRGSGAHFANTSSF